MSVLEESGGSACMYMEKSIAVVVPAFNEEALVEKTVRSMPSFVDKVIVVDDGSVDHTAEILQRLSDESERIVVIVHKVNQGVGGAIASGYRKAVELGLDVTAVMAADGQMDPDDLIPVVGPVAMGDADYTKGNRLFRGDAWSMIPRYRYLGNSFLSLLTKVASGYWHVADSQSGYTAISLDALRRINLDRIYKRYGMPNDMLIKLNQLNVRVRDVHVRPVYNVGEKSGIRLRKVVPRITWLLFRGFWERLFVKYVVKDFHPLVFFYLLSFFLLTASVPLTIRLFYMWAVTGNIPGINTLAVAFSLISGLQTLFFGMWFDMEYNKDLK